jgi:Ca-activated chloride channel family protein
MRNLVATALLLLPLCLSAQAGRSSLLAGNRAYREQQFTKAAEAYQKALGQSPGNLTAGFNLGNALFRDNRMDEAGKAYDQVIDQASTPLLAANAWYNKGVALSAGQKLEESIEAYKNALRIHPSDTLARDNLQRAMNELRRKREQEQQQKKKDSDQQQKLNKQQVQQLLQALQDQEKMLQQKINHSRVPSPSQPEKDW